MVPDALAGAARGGHGGCPGGGHLGRHPPGPSLQALLPHPLLPCLPHHLLLAPGAPTLPGDGARGRAAQALQGTTTHVSRQNFKSADAVLGKSPKAISRQISKSCFPPKRKIGWFRNLSNNISCIIQTNQIWFNKANLFLWVHILWSLFLRLKVLDFITSLLRLWVKETGFLTAGASVRHKHLPGHRLGQAGAWRELCCPPLVPPPSGTGTPTSGQSFRILEEKKFLVQKGVAFLILTGWVFVKTKQISIIFFALCSQT